MTVGGAGIGRHNGLVVFVDYSAPGDTLLVEITEKKKNFSSAKIIKILDPSPSRVKPPCPYFEKCGGCSWQHLSRKEQLYQKQILVEDSLRGLSKTHEFSISPIIPSPQEYHYRNRIQVTAVDGTWNFRRRHSHDFISIQDCLLVEEPLRTALRAPPPQTSQATRYDLRLTEDLKTVITPLDNQVELVGFSQVNRFQNTQLIDEVLSSLVPRPDGNFFELYAGGGNFTFPLLENKNFSHIWAVEASPLLVHQAHQEIQRKNISPKKLSFHLGDVGGFLSSRWPYKNDSVFLDPPRVGASPSVIQTLGLSRPSQILYLSCHPVTLGRDLKQLLQLTPQYKIDFVKPFEMFPQTDHVETLVSLSLG